MKYLDLETLADVSSIETDLCIVGSGPAGASIAMEFAGSKVQVLIVEAGGVDETSADQSLYEVEKAGVICTTTAVRNRIVGGSSHTWSGRCAALNDIDFETRAWVPHSGWPIALPDLRSFLDRARKYLGIGPNIYDDELWNELKLSPPRPQINPAVLKSQFWQYSKGYHNPLAPVRFSSVIEAANSSNVSLLMHANVTHINTSDDGVRVQSLDVRTLDGRHAKVRAKAFVLACGGLENARLLLASNKTIPAGVGNSHDLVGRFLMDHPGCKMGWFDPDRSSPIQFRFGLYVLKHKAGKNAYDLGLMLSPEIQKEEHLLNCAAFLDQAPSNDDSWSAMMRLVRPTADFGRSGRLKDLSVVIGNIPRLLSNAHQRVARRHSPVLRTNELSLYCLVEQTPDPSSRVTLAQKSDALGMPLLRIDWRIGELERRSVMRLNELIASELHRTGLPEYLPNEQLISQLVDRAHPSGTTRMSDSPKRGVVDRNCKVHEVTGLYIAGSSVFPTVGHANPTLMIVALAIRLADRLKCHEFAEKPS